MEQIEELKMTDPEFTEIWERFLQEAKSEEGQQLDDHTRYLSILSALVGCQGVDVFRTVLPEALEKGLTPVMIKEMLYQSAAYMGLGRMLPFLTTTNEILKQGAIPLPLPPQATTATENRREKGTQAQVDIFGGSMEDFWKKGHINRWLAANCFGDYYTRTGLDLKQRELITFCFLAGQGGCEPQLTSHATGNIRIGNDQAFLRKVVSQCLPYIGYPRSLNAIACVNKAAEQQK